MFHRAERIEYKEGTTLEVTFQDGLVKSYDIKRLFKKYPQMEILTDRNLFTSGKLTGAYGIIWNDELDLEAETIYQEGKTVRREKVSLAKKVGCEIAAARSRLGMTQLDLAKATGIDQSDLSKLEKGALNPSLNTLERIGKALGVEISIKF